MCCPTTQVFFFFSCGTKKRGHCCSPSYLTKVSPKFPLGESCWQRHELYIPPRRIKKLKLLRKQKTNGWSHSGKRKKRGKSPVALISYLQSHTRGPVYSLAKWTCLLVKKHNQEIWCLCSFIDIFCKLLYKNPKYQSYERRAKQEALKRMTLH